MCNLSFPGLMDDVPIVSEGVFRADKGELCKPTSCELAVTFMPLESRALIVVTCRVANIGLCSRFFADFYLPQHISAAEQPTRLRLFEIGRF